MEEGRIHAIDAEMELETARIPPGADGDHIILEKGYGWNK
jgi:hypothetical protein